MTQPYCTYRIRITNRYRVQAEKRGPDNELIGEPSGDFDHKGNLKRIRELHEAAFAGDLSGPDLRELSENLFSALFDKGLRHDFLSFYEQSRRQDTLLRIELDVDERQLPDVVALPWEFMCVPSGVGYGTIWLGTAPDLIFSRRRAHWRSPEPIQIKAGERLRIALAVAAPRGLGPVKYERIWNALGSLAREQANRIELLQLVKPATTRSIDGILKQKPHIFHFIGHAQLKDEDQQDAGRIALVDDILNGPMWIEAEGFGELFTRYRPGVVVLQACEGGALSASQAFVGVASQVVQQNIPVVVAMQYEVSNSTAQQFALEFYRSLLEDVPVDRAVQESRRYIALGPSRYETRDFATPVIFMRVRDGHLFKFIETGIERLGQPSASLQSPVSTSESESQSSKLSKFNLRIGDVRNLAFGDIVVQVINDSEE